MKQTTVHDPDRYMVDLRQILSQGKKRIGLLVGAGAPVSVTVDESGNLNESGKPIIPDVKNLTKSVIDSLEREDRKVVEALRPDLGEDPNIEAILTRIRRLSQAIGAAEIHGLDGEGYGELAARICEHIGKLVAAELPEGSNPYTELVAWVGGTHREHPIETFSPNYDLLMEEAFEEAQIPYFDGFSGSHRPFFDPTSISSGSLPVRWARLWKIHGSLGWDVDVDGDGSRVIRTGNRNATKLIYPDHLKYDQITRQPYSALFERLKEFLTTPDSLLICTGFSFFDAHITAVLDEALAANTHTAILAFQYGLLSDEQCAVALAMRRPNMSVYARDGAVIFGVKGDWKTGEPPSDEWVRIRSQFWEASDQGGSFLLGDFAKLARFFVHSQATQFQHKLEPSEENELGGESENGDEVSGDNDAEP